MEPTGNDFDFLNNKLTSLYLKVDMMIKQDNNLEMLNEVLCEINNTYSLSEKAILNHENLSKEKFLTSNLSLLHSEKTWFDKKTAECLQR